MGIPHKPETIEAHRARIDEATRPLWIVADVQQDVLKRGNAADTPGKHRRHVFDFEDGLRLIVSRDNLPMKLESINYDIVLHVSASFEKESPLWGMLSRDQKGFDRFCAIAAKRIGELLDAVVDEKPSLFTGKVAHWFLDE